MLNIVYLLICMYKIYIYEYINKILVNYFFGDKYMMRRGCMLYVVFFFIYYVVGCFFLFFSILCSCSL